MFMYVLCLIQISFRPVRDALSGLIVIYLYEASYFPHSARGTSIVALPCNRLPYPAFQRC